LIVLVEKVKVKRYVGRQVGIKMCRVCARRPSIYNIIRLLDGSKLIKSISIKISKFAGSTQNHNEMAGRLKNS
jgi:hypothetical protein